MIRQVNRGAFYKDVFTEREGNFLDLGANLGIVSLYASPFFKRVVAVEAEPRTFHYLNLVTREIKNIECLHAALAPKTEPVKITVDSQDYSCHTITNPKPNSLSVQVNGMKFSDILSKLGMSLVHVCKVDVEGSEMDSLTVDVFTNSPVLCWYIEVHRTPTMSREKAMTVMLDRLKGARYVCHCPRPNAIVAKV